MLLLLLGARQKVDLCRDGQHDGLVVAGLARWHCVGAGTLAVLLRRHAQVGGLGLAAGNLLRGRLVLLLGCGVGRTRIQAAGVEA